MSVALPAKRSSLRRASTPARNRPGAPAPATADPRRGNRLALAGALLLALALRAPYLGAALGVDEGGIAYIARHWGSGHGSLYGSYWLDRPPLLVLAFKAAVLGGDLGVRALGAAAALALVLAVTLLGRAVGGDRVGRSAGLLAALLTGSVALAAVFTPAELLAAVAAGFSVLCLVLAHRRRTVRWVLAAGLLAVSAALVKQSFLDAGVAGLAFLTASALNDRGVRWRWPVAYLAGGLIPLAALIGWQVAAHLPDGGILYAMFGFRLDALHTLSGSDIPLHVRIANLLLPAVGSGLVLAIPVAVAGVRSMRGDRVLLATFAAWMAGATAGVLGGGSYWPHYLIQLVAVVSVAAALALAAAPPRVRGATLTTATVLAVVLVGGGGYVHAHPLHQADLAVAGYVRAHARPGDTQYVMYARADIAYYDGLRTPYPYMWSLMIRAHPGAVGQLQRLLASPSRPTWLIQWQDVGHWKLDPEGVTAALVLRDYRRAATICGYPIYVRRDRPIPSPPGGGCPAGVKPGHVATPRAAG